MTARAILCLVVLPAAAGDGERVLETVLPALAYGGGCASTIDLRNLGDRAVAVDLEAHGGDGALVAVAGQNGPTLSLAPGERRTLRLQVEGETADAWIKVRETLSAPRWAPAVAIGGHTECVAGDRLASAVREVAYPARNPWFDDDVAELAGRVVTLVNTTETAVVASLCYSSGGLFSVDGGPLRPLCTAAPEVRVPPFATRRFPVERAANTHFSLHARGRDIVLQMLRPSPASVKLFSVESTIRFGEEVR